MGEISAVSLSSNLIDVDSLDDLDTGKRSSETTYTSE
jgi:hypothetical protein